MLLNQLTFPNEDITEFPNQFSGFEISAELVWNRYNGFYNNFVFSNFYGLRSSSCSSSSSLRYESFNCLTLPVPESNIYVKVNVLMYEPDIIEGEGNESYQYKKVVQKSCVCLIELDSKCEKLYDQVAEKLNKSKNEIDLILCCRGSKISVLCERIR